MVCVSEGMTLTHHTNQMAYSIVSGRYFYEEGGDYFTFDALLDEMDHSGAGTFKNGQRIVDESNFSASTGYFILDEVENFSGKAYLEYKFDSEYWDVKSYYDSESGITKKEVSGTGYDNGMPNLSQWGMEGEVEEDGAYLRFNTEDQLDFSVANTPIPSVNLRGTNGNETLDGGGGDDELVGLRGRDYLNGFGGNDILRAGNGRDTIIGGAGADEMYGGFGHNTFMDALDGDVDKLIFKSDQFAYNYIYDKAGNNADGRKVDIIEELDSFDQIMIQGVETDQLSFGYVSNLATPSGQESGIGIFADGFIEGLYTGDNLSVGQLSQMTLGVPV